MLCGRGLSARPWLFVCLNRGFSPMTMQQKKPATRHSVQDEGGADAIVAQQELPLLLCQEYYLTYVMYWGGVTCLVNTGSTTFVSGEHGTQRGAA